MGASRGDGGAAAEADWRGDAERIRALEPGHLLFLCVANSARSQLAEGVARALAPPGVRVSSAGSHPGRVHPLALRALDEIGIDARDHRSKGIDSVDTDSVDVVVTLCADEVCPLLPDATARVHWPLPDPVAGARSEAEALEGFRRTRDLLRERLALVFRR